jgi:hypothetical protein
MTNLEDFLSKKDINYQRNVLAEVDGTFKCQDIECEEIVTKGYFDVDKNKMFWYCSKDHESSMVM